MSKAQKPKRQEYIAKIRYINNLPPPPLNPKFIKYNTTEKKSTNKENEELLTSLFRKENFNTFLEQLDEEHGLNLNLINNTGFLENGDESVIHNLKSASDNTEPVQLHPDDRILLRDANIGSISKSEPGVSFLRRTEYIAERQLPKASEGPAAVVEKLIDESHDPTSQLAAVERTFDSAQETLNDLSKLKHPRKKNLKAVSTWPLLPDTSLMDCKFLNIKFTGSASISRELQALKKQEKDQYDEEFHKNALATNIYKPITSEDGEWISLYRIEDREKAEQLKNNLNSTNPNQPVNLLDEEEDNLENYKFKHFKNYDMQYTKHAKPYEELAIRFIPDENDPKKRKASVFSPISGRINLKKHRTVANTEINKFIKESTADIINFKLREPNTNELRAMDNVRSEFDPMEYEGEEEEEEEEEGAVPESKEGSEEVPSKEEE